MKNLPGASHSLLALISLLMLANCNTWELLPGERRWLKTALHTHTDHSDGEASASSMLKWYRRHGYDVVALTDHNRNMPFGLLTENSGEFLVVPGIEYTSRGGSQPVHLNGLFTLQDVKGIEAATPRQALQKMAADFERAQAVTVINHPNYEGVLTADQLQGLDFSLLEVFNSSSGCRNDGDELTPPVEALWDALLADGRQVYGIATDDAHGLPGGMNSNLPGSAWVMAYARLDLFDLRDALTTGRFYATTGPLLSRYEISAGGLRVSVEAQPGVAYRWEVVDDQGKQYVTGLALSLERPSQGFRRAKLTASDGSRLYLQPLFPL